MGYAIAVVFEKVVVFLFAEIVAKYGLSKKSGAVLRGLVFLWIALSLFNDGFFGTWKQPPSQTVATLMEQVRGDKFHWNQFG